MDLKEEFTTLYKYNALTNLIIDNEEIEDYIENLKINSNFFDCIELCLFEINTESQYKPFLRFLLQKDMNFDLQFFKINGLQLLLNTKTFLELVDDQMRLILNETSHMIYTFHGFYNYNNKMYLFIDISEMKVLLNDVYKSNNKWFVLMDEIMNIKSVCDMEVHNSVIDFFQANPEFIFIQDEKNENMETPIVAYVGKEDKQLEFTYVFGQTKIPLLDPLLEKVEQNQNTLFKNEVKRKVEQNQLSELKSNTTPPQENMLGPYFYFTDFHSAIKQGGWSKDGEHEEKYDVFITENDCGKYKKGGIVRIALFIGNMLIKMNDPDDPIDESEIKKMRLNDPKIDAKYESLTIRITDYDGLWTKDYDSVYLGRIELDDGTFYKESPLYVVKDFNQQYPLSYHYINKKTLGEKYDSNSEYSIM